MIAEIHILHSLPPNLLNSGQNREPKTCVVGGTRRSRLSSQSLKRAARDYLKCRGQNLSTATRRAGTLLDGEPQAVERLLGGVAGFEKGYTGQSGERMMLSRAEVIALNGLLNEYEDELNSPTFKQPSEALKEGVEAALDQAKTLDQALFGRFMASAPRHSIDAAASFAHAFSVNPAPVQHDFWTAVDDLGGNANLGEQPFTSGCMYRYVAVDLSQLKENINGESAGAFRLLVEASVKARLKGARNSFNADTLPEFAAVTLSSEQRNLANAFETPVRAVEGVGVSPQAVERLEAYWAKLDDFYGNAVEAKTLYNLSGSPLTYLAESEATSLDTFLDHAEALTA